MLRRARWVLAVAVGLLSFFGEAPADWLDWLFTDRGRLALLLMALGIGFWPQLSEGVKRRWLEVRPASKRRLRRDTQALVTDVREYVQSAPAPFVNTMEDHGQTVRAMGRATTEDEKSEIWNQHTLRLVESHAREGGRFGGRMSYLIGEYRRRDMLTDAEVSKMEWQLQSLHWATDAANKLEALWRRL